MNTTGLDSSGHPAGLDSWVALRTDLSPCDKATLAIDAITNKLPERSALPFEFFELAVLALQKSTDDARAAVQQHNKTIDELHALCNNLETRLAALSAAPILPPSPSATASTSASVAVHSAGCLSKAPNTLAPQDPTQAATSAKSCIPTPPVALLHCLLMPPLVLPAYPFPRPPLCCWHVPLVLLWAFCHHPLILPPPLHCRHCLQVLPWTLQHLNPSPRLLPHFQHLLLACPQATCPLSPSAVNAA